MLSCHSHKLTSLWGKVVSPDGSERSATVIGNPGELSMCTVHSALHDFPEWQGTRLRDEGMCTDIVEVEVKVKVEVEVQRHQMSLWFGWTVR